MVGRKFTNPKGHLTYVIKKYSLIDPPYDPRTQDFEDKSHFSFDGHLLFERLEVQKYLPFEKQIKEMIFSILRSILVRNPPLQCVLHAYKEQKFRPGIHGR